MVANCQRLLHDLPNDIRYKIIKNVHIWRNVQKSFRELLWIYQVIKICKAHSRTQAASKLEQPSKNAAWHSKLAGNCNENNGSVNVTELHPYGEDNVSHKCMWGISQTQEIMLKLKLSQCFNMSEPSQKMWYIKIKVLLQALVFEADLAHRFHHRNGRIIPYLGVTDVACNVHVSFQVLQWYSE